MSAPMGWPDPSKPGVPLNPHVDGWHFLRDSTGTEARVHWTKARGWMGHLLYNHAEECFYAGPCFTPAEVAAREQAARVAALEEAAQIADRHQREHGEAMAAEGLEPIHRARARSGLRAARHLAASIRALAPAVPAHLAEAVRAVLAGEAVAVPSAAWKAAQVIAGCAWDEACDGRDWAGDQVQAEFAAQGLAVEREATEDDVLGTDFEEGDPWFDLTPLGRVVLGSEDMVAWARSQRAHDDWEDNPEAVRNILLLMGDVPEDLAIETVAGWTPAQRYQAERWAALAHLSASDNDDVVVPPRPSFVPFTASPYAGAKP